MKTRTLFAALAIPATAAGLLAQQRVPDNPEAAAKMDAENRVVIAQGIGGAFALESGPNVRFVNQEFSFGGRVVTGSPYSADEKTESVQTLADDVHITNTTTTRIYRDSQGRTRREMTLPSFKGETTPHTLITINDPVNGVSYSLDPESKVAHKMPIPTPMATKLRAEVEAQAMEAEAKMKAQVRASTSGGVGYQVTVRHSEEPGPEVKHEDLGANVMEGVSVTGTRETTVIAAGRIGNDKPITITSETWFSPDLKTEVKSVHSDPRMGQTTHTLSNISRTEPDSSLFLPPSDYKLEESGPTLRYEKFETHRNE